MLRLVFAAHDPGATVMLDGAIGTACKRGHDIRFLCTGPAEKIWKGQGRQVVDPEVLRESTIDQWVDAVDLVVTGTGFGEFEKNLWPLFRAHNQRTFAVIDSWSNLDRRFTDPMTDGRWVLPDAIGVIDEWSVDRILSGGWCDVPVHVVGQPHLQHISRTVRARRRNRPVNNPRVLVFFSEPVREDFPGNARGFDQIDVLSDLVVGLKTAKPMQIFIKRHPRESHCSWLERIEKLHRDSPHEVRMAENSAEDLLILADVVVGMTSMVLVEAVLSNIPTLSCQPGRTGTPLAIIDELVPVVLNMQEIAGAVDRALAEKISEVGQVGRLAGIIANADARFVDVIEQVAAARI